MKKDFRGTVRKPQAFTYGFFARLLKVYSKGKYHLKSNIKELEQIKGPAVIVCNHPSFQDFIFSGAMVYPSKINFVLGYSFYNIKKITKLVYNLGAFPKLQFQNDIGAMKNMKRVIDNNGILGIYPVGLVSENGEGGDVPLATASFLKWLKCDVYIGYTTGSYMIKPKWAKNSRKGEISINFKKLISKEDLSTISTSELQKNIEKELYFNEYENNKDKKFKGKDLALGLENLAYRCPKCNGEFTTTSEGNTLKCKCGNECTIDEYGHLHKVKEDDVCFDTPLEWYNYEAKLIREELENGTFLLEDDVELHMPSDIYSPYSKVGEGHIKMVKDDILYTGTINGEEQELHISTKGLMACAFKFGTRFEIQYHNTVYVFYPKNKQSVLKYSIAIRQAYKMDNLEN